MMDYYRQMITIRLVEDRLQKLCDEGLAGDLHFNKGQEAIAVGVCEALLPDDRIVTHHRTIAHEIARGADLRSLVAEVLGKKSGVNGGRAGEMHISNKEIGHAFSFQLVGTCIPVAAGLAWALKYHHRTEDIVAVFFGDAASSNGQFHEGLSLAAIHRLPLLLVCENNHRAGNIESRHYMPVPRVRDRVAGYGIECASADGNSIVDVVDAASDARAWIARHGRPFFIEFDTTRLCWHKQGQRDARSPIALAEEARRDPLKAIPAEQLSPLTREIESAIDAVFKRVLKDEPPGWP